MGEINPNLPVWLIWSCLLLPGYITLKAHNIFLSKQSACLGFDNNFHFIKRAICLLLLNSKYSCFV